MVITGAPGAEEYAGRFESWAQAWLQAAQAGGWQTLRPGEKGSPTLADITQALQSTAGSPVRPLWLVLIGHGTFDGRQAAFNLPGPDLQPEQLKQLLPKDRPICVVACFSASGPFLPTLSHQHRVIITATASGNEINFSRWGGELAGALQDLAADLDKDQQVSLLEAFLLASRRNQEFYAGDGRLMTEHPVLDDNGDARPVPPAGFEGIRPVKRLESAATLPDGVQAHQWILIPTGEDARLDPAQLARRNEIELEIARLRNLKERLPEDQYYQALEKLLLDLAQVILPSPVATGRPMDSQ